VSDESSIPVRPLLEQADYLPLSHDAWTSSAEITSKEIALKFEQALEKKPMELRTRVKLLGFYTELYGDLDDRQATINKEEADHRLPHILWFIENLPACRFAGSGNMLIHKVQDSVNYATAKAAWLEQIRKNPDDAMVAINAATFLFWWDRPKAKSIINDCLKNDSTNLWARDMLLNIQGKQTRIEIPEQESGLDESDERIKQITTLTELADHIDLTSDSVEGARMMPAQITALQQTIQQNPNDLRARARLLGFTFTRYTGCSAVLRYDPELAATRLEQVIWVIQNIPGSEFAGSPIAYDFQEDLDPEQLEKLKYLWRNQLKTFPKSEHLLLNRFFTFADPGEAESLVKKVLLLNPDNEKATRRLAHLIEMRDRRRGSERA
jgi:hypothetical protein